MRNILCVLSCLLAAINIYGQNLRISGVVTDAEAFPLAGVQIEMNNKKIHTVTDSAGKFRFSALQQDSYVIKFSKRDFQTQIIALPISNFDTTLVIQLRNDNYRILDEVVVEYDPVTLRKKEDALNVQVVTSTFIKRNLGGSLMKTLERLPGIKTIGIGSGQSKPLIRGLGFNRVIVLDRGVKHEGQQWGADHGLEIDQFATGEVHLVKGAASFMYGSDAIAGAIDVVAPSAPLVDMAGGSVEMVGKTNNHLIGSSVNIFGRRKRWHFDARITYQDYADYRVPADRVSIYNYEVKLLEKRLRNTAGKESGLHFTGGYIGKKIRSNVYISNTFSNSGFFANAHGLEPRNVDPMLHDGSHRDILMPRQEVNHFKVVNRNQFKVAGQQLEVDLAYQHNFRQEYSQYVNHGYMPAVYPDTMKIPSNLEREFDKHTFSSNIRNKFRIGDHELTAGINGEHQENSINGWSFLVPSFRQTAAGAFVYDKYRINEQFLFHAAARYDFTRLNMFGYTDWFTSEMNGAPPAESQKLVRAEAMNRSFSSMVWSVGLNYNADPISVKFNAGKSFRVPIPKELAANGVNYHYFSYERGNPGLDAEQSYQADASLGWNGQRLTVVLSPFYNYFPNYIYLNPTANHDYFYGAGNQVFQYEQSRVQRYGAELQFKYKFSDQVSTEVLGEYLQSKQMSGNKKGYTLPFSPPPSALFNVTWSTPHEDKFRQSYVSVDYRLVGRQHQIVPPEKKTPGYQIINLQAGSHIHIGRQTFDIRLQVHNLLDSKYLNHTSFYRLIELPEAGRNIVLTIKVPFLIRRYE